MLVGLRHKGLPQSCTESTGQVDLLVPAETVIVTSDTTHDNVIGNVDG